MSAGPIVSAPTTATATATAAETPIAERKGRPTMTSPTSAVMTVMPAKTTADPAVAVARAAASSPSMPSRTFSRNRESRKRE